MKQEEMYLNQKLGRIEECENEFEKYKHMKDLRKL